ncbi:MAG: ATP-grasp domain-containing protein [Anaerolineales bacterium]|nr:ATP-grasp domain-containing protein [Anaerolineales bacterium]
MKNYKILFRSSGWKEEEEEKKIASKHFDVISQRTEAKPGDIIIGRYSVLPFYKELENDLQNQESQLINSFHQHQYIADIKNWYEDLEQETFKTWFRAEDIPLDEPGPFVLKGQTNSRKFLWKTHMFAKDKEELSKVFERLLDDSLIGTQEIYFRKYEKLKKFDLEEINGIPISNEWRFFVAENQIISKGFYWSSHLEDIKESGQKIEEPDETLVKRIIEKVGNNASFYVVDVAQKEDNSWMMVELNDGQMSGLSDNSPETLYSGLRKVLK